jgi:hypothetical protein
MESVWADGHGNILQSAGAPNADGFVSIALKNEKLKTENSKPQFKTQNCSTYRRNYEV